MTEDDKSIEQNQQIATAIKEELARRRISRQFLADQAKLSLSTLEKALSGVRPFTLASLVRIEEALQIKLRKLKPTVPDKSLAPRNLGAYYSHPAIMWLEGDYVTLRRSFGDPTAIYAYRTEILWDEDASHLVFRESERIDAAFKQDGAVSAPPQSGYIYLITNKVGQYRLIILARPSIRGEMFGLLTTLQAGRGSMLTPVATPIVMVPVENLKPHADFGVITQSDRSFASYEAFLRRALDESFVKLIS